jgi:nanoRNase/pAp phosphatase (c-di-AMP/oligoRNAs hydrolase)
MLVWCIHHNDLDGVASAWLIKKYFHQEILLFTGVTYSQPPPVLEDVTPDKIVIVDFSYNAKDLAILRQRHPDIEILIIDHHKTAVQYMQDTSEDLKINWVIDATATGACLVVHNYIFPTQSPHPLIKAIADYDGWKFELEYTKEINEALHMYRHTDLIQFVFDDITTSTVSYDKLIEQGTLLYKSKMMRVDIMSKKCRMINFEGYTVPFVNCTDSINEVAQHLLDKFKDSPFCMVYYDDNLRGIRKYSLRSRDFNLIPIVTKYGGGGHNFSAAFSLPLNII